MKNIIEQFLDEIEVSYTHQFTEKLYNEHPHKYNMYGLKRMLDVYGVKTLGVHSNNADLLSLTYPCILHTHGDFVIGLECKDDSVIYLQHGKKLTLAIDKFKQTWTNNALVVEETTEAIEPDYKTHQWKELISKMKSYSLPFMLILAVLIGIVSHWGNTGIFDLIRIAFSSVGVLVCILLMEKQLTGESHYGDRVCSLFHHSDCNSVLDGAMAKIFGISWSEVGLGYFMANMLLLSLFPASSSMVAVVSWAAMLYGVWSIYYQWRVAKSWCVLCVLTQVIIWLIGIIAIVSYFYIPFSCYGIDGLLVCIVFAESILLVHQYALVQETEKERVRTVQQYRSFKVNSTVSKVLIGKGEYYETTLDDSSIIFGNPQAETRVTILSNPHCNPCARMHKQVENLLNINSDDICVQYIFSSFNETLEDSSRYLIAMYQNKDQQTAREIYSSWYEKDKNKFKEIMEGHAGIIHSGNVEAEMKKHLAWKKRTGFTAT